jgi:hypothetical protein
MVDVEQQAKEQLIMIENICALKLTNRDEVARLIASKVQDESQILTICTSLSSWILLNGKSGDVVIPHEVISQLIESGE